MSCTHRMNFNGNQDKGEGSMRRTEERGDGLRRCIEEVNAELEVVEDLNRMLAMPPEFHEIVKGNRRPIHELSFPKTQIVC